MAIETEVKYLINKLPDNLPHPMYIEQRYFEPVNTLNKILELFNLESLDKISTRRVRLIKTDKISYVITLKTKGMYSRVEYEKEINEELYNEILKEKILSCVIKNRYKVINSNYVFEFDEYLNLKTKLYTCEVEDEEFDKHKKEIEDILKEYFKIEYIDVTLDPKYKNSNLIKYFG
ncbi:MAG: hypothetical protein IJB21_07945 [Bacilli bacterium]|nr:hypothetical protein [Bacilli bacterium]